MNKKVALQALLDQVLQSGHGAFVRSQGAPDTVKNGGDEFYFNLSPHTQFRGRMACMVISRKTGAFQLGVSFGGSRGSEAFYRQEMQALTGNTANYGTSRPGKTRNDILRCEIPDADPATALQIFIKFYERIKTAL